MHLNAAGGQLDPVTVNHLPAPVKHEVFLAIAHAIDGVFIWAAPAAILVFVLAWFIKEVPLRSSVPPPQSEAPASEPIHIVHFALKAEARGQKTPTAKTHEIGGAIWAMMSLMPAKMLL